MPTSRSNAENFGTEYCDAVSRKQEHVFRWWHESTPAQRDQLCRQMKEIDLELLQRLYHQTPTDDGPLVLHPIPSDRFVPLATTLEEGRRDERMARLGQEALSAGRVAVVLVAGGQGTRLGHDGPKGTYPIGPVSGKSLFQIHAEKVLALRRRHGAPLPLYVMVSPENHATTHEFFVERAFFGLDPQQVAFFRQGTLPALDRESGKLLLDEKHRVAVSPDGHGGVVKALAGGGHLDDMRRQGIDYIFFYQVDNPMVKVADPTYLGYHIDADAEMSLKVVRKLSPAEKMGVVVEVDDETAGRRLQIVEYGDLPDEPAQRRAADGSLEIWAGNIAVHVFNRSLLECLATDGGGLPYHRAAKAVPYLDDIGQLVHPTEPNAVKFERFVFDALPLARKALVVEADRAEEFEPIKNAEGANSPATARQAMSNLFAEWLTRAEIEVAYREDGSAAVGIEISPLWALDAEELRDRLAGHPPVDEPLLLDDETQLVSHAVEI